MDQVSWEDARWFCAWLSTQPQLVPDNGVYNYRLPTPEDWQTAAVKLRSAVQPWTTEPNLAGHGLRVVRQRIPDRYRALVNYLASGSWKEADQETDRLMLKVVGTAAEKRGYLMLDEIRNFPCEDLRLIDQLWVKFSGGKFGFSVQKKIYIDCGAKLDCQYPGDEIWYDFCDRIGWRKDNKYVNFASFTFDPSISPAGQIPSRVSGWELTRWRNSDGFPAVSDLLSHSDL